MSEITLLITDRDGIEHTIMAPTDMSMNLMEIIRSFELVDEGTIGICGGMAMCASCHVYINSQHELSEKSDEEKIYRVNDCLKRVNLENCNNLKISELSGGMIKRVSIARAIVMNPKYLLCDEPNSGLDPKTAIIIDNLIQEITQESNITTIVNTHDMNSVMEIGQKIAYINNGEISWTGNKEELLKSNNKQLNDFVFASELFKRLKKL